VHHPATALEGRADLIDAVGDRDVQCAKGRRADRPVGRETVPLLERLHARLHRRVVPWRRIRRGRFREVARHAEAAAEPGDASVGHAGLEWRTRGNGFPASSGGDAAGLGERALEARVERIARLQLLERLVDLAPVDRLLENVDGVDAAEVALQVPVRVESLRIDLAEAQVVREPHRRVREQQVEPPLALRGRGRRRAHALDGREMIVGGIEASPALSRMARRRPSVAAAFHAGRNPRRW
jgi:hypothetical protein